MDQNNKDELQKDNMSKNEISDGIDVEYYAELADEYDIVAQARSKAADERAKNKNSTED